jgi:adenine-specific DNA-methyltransferase
MPQVALERDGWQIEPTFKRDLLARIRAAGVALGEYVEGQFYYGIKTGYNEAFVIDGLTRAELIDPKKGGDPKSAEIIKPYLRGRDIKRWRVEPQDLWLIQIESSGNVQHPWTGLPDDKAEEKFAETWPSIHRRFNSPEHLEPLKKRQDKGKFYWELRACAYWREFAEPKIFYPDIYERQSFAWDAEGVLSGNTAYFIPTDERWMCGILNSQVIEWYYRQVSNAIMGGYLRAFTEVMQNVPIARPDFHERAVVDALVAALWTSPNPALEKLLNGLVYELYFRDDLHARGLRLFAAALAAGIDRLSGLEGTTLTSAAEQLGLEISDSAHPIYRMLFDLRAIDVVRIIEGIG